MPGNPARELDRVARRPASLGQWLRGQDLFVVPPPSEGTVHMHSPRFRIAAFAIGTILIIAACATPAQSASPTGSAAPATITSTTPVADATAPVDSTPPGPPLKLVWQTGGAPGDLMSDPIHLAMGPHGDIYVGSATPTGLIRVFDSNGHFVTAWGKNGAGDGEFDFLLGIGIDGHGNVYAADFNRVLINKFDGTGRFLLS